MSDRSDHRCRRVRSYVRRSHVGMVAGGRNGAALLVLIIDGTGPKRALWSSLIPDRALLLGRRTWCWRSSAARPVSAPALRELSEHKLRKPL
jgi:hypothetical protein